MLVKLVKVAEWWCLTVFGCDTEASAWQFRSATITCKQIGIRRLRVRFLTVSIGCDAHRVDQKVAPLGELKRSLRPPSWI